MQFLSIVSSFDNVDSCENEPFFMPRTTMYLQFECYWYDENDNKTIFISFVKK